MSQLAEINRAVVAADVEIPLEDLPADQIVEGSPQTGYVDLGTIADVEVGLWEMTPGVATDLEEDEWFIVLSGRATVEFEDGTSAELAPGTVMKLASGVRTTWKVTETLRKVYVA